MSYGTAKRTSPRGDEFGTGVEEAVVATETANNACIGGAMIPLLSFGIPGSPPAAMLLGALMLHGISPGPMLRVDRPGFIFQVSAILLLASIAMWVIGMLLSKQVIKILKIPITLFMPVIGVLCVIGSYALGLNIFNLFLMVPVGLMSYFLIQNKYPIAPLVIGVILGNMFERKSAACPDGVKREFRSHLHPRPMGGFHPVSGDHLHGYRPDQADQAGSGETWIMDKNPVEGTEKFKQSIIPEIKTSSYLSGRSGRIADAQPERPFFPVPAWLY